MEFGSDRPELPIGVARPLAPVNRDSPSWGARGDRITNARVAESSASLRLEHVAADDGMNQVAHAVLRRTRLVHEAVDFGAVGEAHLAA